jgi:hypothetical protein
MALYDGYGASQAKKRLENYEELKEFISKVGKDGNLSEWYEAYQHIRKIEMEKEELENKLAEYKSFFGLLQKLMPKVHSGRDAIF